jgi:hypothetical protein
MAMGLRTARQLAVLMVTEFQPYGATWAELMKKSGMTRHSYKRAFNRAKEMKWLVGGGGQGKPYYLNPDGCWRAAVEPPSERATGSSVSSVKSDCHPETRDSEPGLRPAGALDPSKADRLLALTSAAIQHINQKKS